MDGRRRIPMHQSLIRPVLLGGAERGLALMNGVISAALIFGIGSWQAAVIGIGFALIVHMVLVNLAKQDCQFFDVYKRHITYQDFYPAQASQSAPAPLIKYLNK
ncbi:conjugal transfer protein TrbD [Limnobacter sp. MED105]|uniref:conjugal transfer protein TrbD n=1 Tax=Limnobacter sp. MED105 TaxID=391597 RepID=UPI000A028FBF|nr:conjugal transfer protein TrbD [Limnobacter sp. MED105]